MTICDFLTKPGNEFEMCGHLTLGVNTGYMATNMDAHKPLK